VAKLDPDDPRAPYLQVAHRLRTEIDTGRLAPGAQLPSYGELADEYGVALGTAKRAVGVLREEGVIVVRHGIGSFVRTHAAASEDVAPSDIEELRAELADVRQRLEEVERRLGVEAAAAADD
jgi:DNA-binding GntR family transcriptional regulator